MEDILPSFSDDYAAAEIIMTPAPIHEPGDTPTIECTTCPGFLEPLSDDLELPFSLRKVATHLISQEHLDNIKTKIYSSGGMMNPKSVRILALFKQKR